MIHLGYVLHHSDCLSLTPKHCTKLQLLAGSVLSLLDHNWWFVPFQALHSFLGTDTSIYSSTALMQLLVQGLYACLGDYECCYHGCESFLLKWGLPGSGACPNKPEQRKFE